MKRASAGFSLIEVLVAVVVLGVGLVALVGSSAMVTRMIGRGKITTRAAQVASSRLEKLRVAAFSTTPRCTSASFATGGPLTAAGITESWTVSTGSSLRTVQVTVSYRTSNGTRSNLLQTRIRC